MHTINQNTFAYHMRMNLSVCKSLVLCGVVLAGFRAGAAQAEPLRVLTSFYPVYVAALNVTAGIDGVEVDNLASPRVGCLHDYQMTTGDARKIAAADVFLVNGAGMEPFLESVARQSPRLRVVEVSRGIPLLDGNPHVWVSFEGARRQVDNIAEVLGEASPANAEAFRANAGRYKERINALEMRARERMRPFAGAPIVTFHAAFPYLARDLGLEIAGVIAREPGSEPVAQELAATIELVRARHVKGLFAEPQFPEQSAGIVARETGLTVHELDPVVTGPSAPEEAREAWLRAMENNVSVLAQALR